MIETTRDILLIIFLVLGTIVSLVVLIATWLIAKAVLRLLRSARRTLDNVQDLTASVDKVAKPLAASSNIAFRVGSILGFVTGFGRRRRRRDRRRRSDDDD